MKINKINCICLILLFIYQLNAEETINNKIYIKLYHAFDNKMEFTPRGTLTISNSKDVSVSQKSLTQNEILSLKQTSLEGGYYYIKSVSYESLDDEKPLRSAITFIKACSLYESLLSDVMTVTLDSNEQFIGLSFTTTNPHCIPKSSSLKSTSFNTTAYVMTTSVAPGPDTQTFILRMEQEKAEKLRGDKTDNRSFFAKYWMYIIPAVILLIASAGSGTEGQGAR